MADSISRDEFEEGKILTDLDKAILDYLEANRERAFTFGILFNAMGFEEEEVPQGNIGALLKNFGFGLLRSWGLQTRLEGLVEAGKVEKRLIEGQDFYSAAKPKAPRSAGRDVGIRTR